MESFRTLTSEWYVFIRGRISCDQGGNTECLDPSTLNLLQQPPQSPMIGTLIAPLAVLFNFFALERKGNGAAAVQHLSKLFHLSSMPREYIPLLTAEMLPILDRILLILFY